MNTPTSMTGAAASTTAVSHPNNKNSIIYAIARDERYPHIVDSHLCSQVIGPKTIGFNAGHIWNVDNTDPAAVSRALMQGRVLAEEFRQALADYYPSAFASAYLVSTAQLMGVREGRGSSVTTP